VVYNIFASLFSVTVESLLFVILRLVKVHISVLAEL
jgi:hypothetical protein